MDCQHLHRSAGLASLWHLRRCPSCRAAQSIDKVIARGIERMQVEPAPASGQARVLTELTALFPPRPRSQPKPIWCRRVLPSGILTVGLTTAGYGWVYWSNLDPNVMISGHTIPPVNAFDTYRSAYEAVKYMGQIGRAETNQPWGLGINSFISTENNQTTTIRPMQTIITEIHTKEIKKKVSITVMDKNHHKFIETTQSSTIVPIPLKVVGTKQLIIPGASQPADLRKAGGMPRVQRPDKNRPSGVSVTSGARGPAATGPRDPLAHLPFNHAYTLQEKELLLQRNVRALALLRKGLQEPYLSPAVRSKNDFQNYLNGYDRLADLMEFEQTVCEERGDWAGAVNSGLDAMQFGEQIAHGEGTTGYCSGMEYARLGRRRLWEEIRHLNAAQARAAGRRLARIITLHAPLADAYQEDKWSYQSRAEERFHNPDWRLNTSPPEINYNPNYNPLELEHPNVVRWHNLVNWLRLLPLSKRQILDQGTSYVDQHIEAARRPYSAKPAPLHIPRDPANEMLLAIDEITIRDADLSLQGNILVEANDRTQLNMLLIIAMLQAYRCDHGAYPSTLFQLIPGYLKAVPEDPFVVGGRLHYRRKGAQYVLYSLGPDSIDQQGKPIEDPQVIMAYKSEHYRVRPDATGDIVAGINDVF